MNEKGLYFKSLPLKRGISEQFVSISKKDGGNRRVSRFQIGSRWRVSLSEICAAKERLHAKNRPEGLDRLFSVPLHQESQK